MLLDPRHVIEQLCAERGEDFAGLSRMLGRNPAYIQQFIRRGIPKKLREEDRRKLALYLVIPESMLGGPDPLENDHSADLVAVRRDAIRVSAGPGAIPVDESGKPYFAFDGRWLKALTATPANQLTIIRVEGDSMAPTLNTGDDILVDLADRTERLRDGIYVLRVDDALLVKRLALNPVARRVTVQSDNPAYADWPDCAIGEIHCVGRVIWAGRRIS